MRPTSFHVAAALGFWLACRYGLWSKLRNVCSWIKKNTGDRGEDIAEASSRSNELIEGVHLLHMPQDVVRADIVFIHGLQVSKTREFWWKTWLVKGAEDSGECWPQVWLPGEFPNLRVLALEYDSEARGKDPLKLWEQAVASVNKLIGRDVELGTRPFFLVGHSMGGLLAKELLLRLQTAPYGDDNLLEMCKGVIFYGVPHLGSGVANMATFLNAVFLGLPGTNSFVTEELKLLGEASFRRNMEFRAMRLETYNFVESRHTQLAPGVSVMVVDKASAGVDTTAKRMCFVEADHYNVCRPANKKSLVYREFVNFLKETLEKEKFPVVVQPGELRVGLDEPVRAVKELLRPRNRILEGVAVAVCIHGMGGIGKSTLAWAVFEDEEIESRFWTRRYFLKVGDLGRKESPREADERKCKLQSTLLEMVGHGHRSFTDPRDGRRWIQSKLRSEKVLLVLDDVWDADDAPVVASDLNPGSRILVTSRDEGVVRNKNLFPALEVFELSKLDAQQSLQLLCLRAFGRESPPEGVQELVLEACWCCDGLPLALEVVGARANSSHDNERNCWIKIVEDMQKTEWNDDNVGSSSSVRSPHHILRTSYEAAPRNAQTCFILIGAFILRRFMASTAPFSFEEPTLKPWLGRWLAAAVHQGSILDANHSLAELEARALIKWETKNLSPWKPHDCSMVYMHELLADVACELSEQGSIRKRCFLFCQGAEILEEARWKGGRVKAHYVMFEGPVSDLETAETVGPFGEDVKSVICVLDHLKSAKGQTHPWEKVSKLEALMLWGNEWENADWSDSPKQSRESDGKRFCIEDVVGEKCLNLRMLQVRLLCAEGVLFGFQKLVRLRTLSLHFCKNLTALEGLGALPGLESLDLTWCEGLTSLEGLGTLSALQSLDLSMCSGLRIVEGLSRLSALQSLDMTECSGLTGLEALGAMSDLQSLNLMACRGLTALEGLGALSVVQSLNLTMCQGLTGLEGLGALTSLQSLDLTECAGLSVLESLAALSVLCSLHLAGCSGLTSLEGLGALSNLHSLDLAMCSCLTVLEGLGVLSALQRLDLVQCSGLTALEGLGSLSALTRLHITMCPGLTVLEGLEALSALEDLNLSMCSGLTALEGLGALSALRSLDLGMCLGLTVLEGLEALSALEILDLTACSSLLALEGLGTLCGLQTLELFRCSGLTALEGLGNLSNLKSLGLCECLGLTALEGLGALSALESLDLERCSGLTALEGLGALKTLDNLNLPECSGLTALEGLSTLSALETLDLYECSGLTSLGGLGTMSCLRRVNVRGCSRLMLLPTCSSDIELILPMQFELAGGGIPSLLPSLEGLLRSEREWEREAAARTVQHMAGRCDEDRMAISSHGGLIPALQAVLRPSGTSPGKKAAMDALQELSKDYDNEILINAFRRSVTDSP